MKICPHCKADNEDQYIYCQNCRKPLPKASRLELKFNNGLSAIRNGDYRRAHQFFDEILKLNIGDKDAWFMKGIALLNMGDKKGAQECFKRAGITVRGGTCTSCGGFKRCNDCGGTGQCYMCKGKGRCQICGGTGACPQCGHNENPTPECPTCHGTKKCRRCGGSGDCTECKGTGSCACAGSGICPHCGGTGHSIQINFNDIPKHLQPYIPE